MAEDATSQAPIWPATAATTPAEDSHNTAQLGDAKMPADVAASEGITRLLQGVQTRLYPYRHLWALISFFLGLGSYFLVQRHPGFATGLTALLVATWLLLLTENIWSAYLQHLRSAQQLSRGALKLLVQSVHQEALFFCLPFVLLEWSGGFHYGLFTALVAVSALVSILDPLYFRLVQHKALYFAFHAWVLFLALLLLLPLIGHLPTGQAFEMAAWLTAIFALPSCWQVIKPHSIKRWALVVACLGLLATLPFWGASWVPPLTVSLDHKALALSLDRQQRQPLVEGSVFTPQELTAGLYAYTAIRAPLGLGQSVRHDWYHDGRLVDTIPLQVTGGRAAGYRTWSYKRHFGATPQGSWRVEVRTGKQQLIGVLHFKVVTAGP